MVIVIGQHLDVSFEVLVLLDVLLEFPLILIELMNTLTISLLRIQINPRRCRINSNKIGAISRSVGLKGCVRIKTILVVLIQCSLGHAHILGSGVVI